MFGVGDRVDPHGEVPGPPYSVDVIADLHAGVYPDDFSELLTPRVLADPDAGAVWAALEATTAQLGGLRDSSIPPPPFVRERIDQTLRTLTDNNTKDQPVTWLARHRGALVSSLAAAAAVAGIAVATTFAFTGDSGDTGSTPIATHTSPIDTLPDSGLPDSDLPDSDLPISTLLGVLGSTDGKGFADTAAQDRCLRAHQIPPSTTILGSGSIDNAGHPAVVILLSTGTIGVFDALVVGTDCTTGNPATISRTTIGDK
jgi:hypothetical protein